MFKLFKSLLNMGIILALVSCTKTRQPATEISVSIIPEPNQINVWEGSFNIAENVSVHLQSDDFSGIGQYLVETLGIPSTPLVATEDQGPEGAIYLGLNNQLPAEGYELEVHDDRISILGGDQAGVFYGIQTLRQLVNGGKNVQSVSIKDAPRFGYRGMMFDVSRHFFGVKDVKKFLDVMALHKYNRFHWHLTDDQGWRIEIKKYPKLTEVGSTRKGTIVGHLNPEPYEFDGIPHGGFYTQEEVTEIVNYAADRHIEVIPEIEMPGHSTAALAAYPEFGCSSDPVEVTGVWGVHPNLLCPTDETFAFLEDVLSEVMGLFPSQYIHIGADEAIKDQWEASEFCQQLIEQEGVEDEHGLQSYFVKRIEEYLNANNRKLIGWDEILEGGLSPNATVMSWRGEKGGIEAAKQSHDVIMTPTTYLYFDYYQAEPKEEEPLAIGGLLPLDVVYNYEPIPSELSQNQEKYILGAQANLWTEYIPDIEYVEYMVLPRMTALAEVVWSKKEQKDYDRFVQKLQPMFALYDRLGINYAKHHKE